jgi:hypothetical protein
MIRVFALVRGLITLGNQQRARFSIECACFDRYVSLSTRHPEDEPQCCSKLPWKFREGRGIGSAALQVSNLLTPTSMKSVQPLRAAEQTLRLRPSSSMADRAMLARLRVASREGGRWSARLSLQAQNRDCAGKARRRFGAKRQNKGIWRVARKPSAPAAAGRQPIVLQANAALKSKIRVEIGINSVHAGSADVRFFPALRWVLRSAPSSPLLRQNRTIKEPASF